MVVGVCRVWAKRESSVVRFGVREEGVWRRIVLEEEEVRRSAHHGMLLKCEWASVPDMVAELKGDGSVVWYITIELRGLMMVVVSLWFSW